MYAEERPANSPAVIAPGGYDTAMSDKLKARLDQPVVATTARRRKEDLEARFARSNPSAIVIEIITRM